MPSKSVQDEGRHMVCLVEERGKKRGEYLKITLKEKVIIGKYASEHGVASAVKKVKTKNLKESSVRDWQDAYLREFDELKKAKPGEEVSVKELSSKKRGRPVLLGAKMDECLQQLLLGMRYMHLLGLL